jgi:heterotetrameric sarcosine oxidase delta subunit
VTFLITCPNCGPREALEFSFGGEVTPPAEPGATGRELAAAWYVRRNMDGWQTEWWVHRGGCRAWILVERHTRTNEVRRTCLPRDRTHGETRAESASG